MTDRKLDPYQVIGAQFLAERAYAYLADEPGLGKTPQAIVAANMCNMRSIHVTAPAVAVPNWKREIDLWATNPAIWTISSYYASTKALPAADIHIVDEAHYLKTSTSPRNSARAENILLDTGNALHRAKRTWALSGTPAPNSPYELWTWLHACDITELGPLAFLSRYCSYYHTNYGPKITGAKNVNELVTLTKDFMLRRTYAEVIPDMPALRWGEISLTGPSGLEISDQLLEIEDELIFEDDEHLARMRRLIGEAKAGPLADYLAEELDNCDYKIVIFAHHTSVIDTIKTRLHRFGVVGIDGRTPKAKRDEPVQRFQHDPSVRVFVGQIVAAGTAITLTAARHFVFAEMSFTPTDNEQAYKRVYRRGQKHPVLVRAASLRGSLDEAVVGVCARKTRTLKSFYEGVNSK